MMKFSLTDRGIGETVQIFENIGWTLMNFEPIADVIERIMRQDNEAARLQGVDWMDQPLAPLAESTIKRRKGTGPPLIPEFQGSRFIGGFYTQKEYSHSAAEIIGSWPSAETFILAHVRGRPPGRPPMPARDIVGVRETAWQDMLVAVDEWITEALQASP